MRLFLERERDASENRNTGSVWQSRNLPLQKGPGNGIASRTKDRAVIPGVVVSDSLVGKFHVNELHHSRLVHNRHLRACFQAIGIGESLKVRLKAHFTNRRGPVLYGRGIVYIEVYICAPLFPVFCTISLDFSTAVFDSASKYTSPPGNRHAMEEKMAFSCSSLK